MEINQITDLIENFAPLETQEAWDCSGWQIDLGEREIKKILLCVSVTEQIIAQAIEKNCDMIIAHHPLFSIPLSFNKNIPIYSAHTNLDKTDGGTTDTLINQLGFDKIKKAGDFLRIVNLENEINLVDFIANVKQKLEIETIRVVNNNGQKNIKKLAFCAGSGIDFLPIAEEKNADILITGDVKYHAALDCGIIILDIGHFESERPVLKTLKILLKQLGIEVVIANEKSPFINY